MRTLNGHVKRNPLVIPLTLLKETGYGESGESLHALSGIEGSDVSLVLLI